VPAPPASPQRPPKQRYLTSSYASIPYFDPSRSAACLLRGAIAEPSRHARIPGVAERYGGDRREDIDAVGRPSQLEGPMRDLATLRTDVTLFTSVDALESRGPTAAFAPLAERFAGAAGGSAPTSSTFPS
jgi:hypothetical protein